MMNIKKSREQFKKVDAKRDQGLLEPQDIIKKRDISYGKYGSENLLDVYYPQNVKSKLPTIVSIHGGGFFYGDKELYRFYTMSLAQQGFLVINFNYRLAPQNVYPAPLEDTNAVMNWLVENETNYPIDLDNLFIVGDSAGGQIASQYATMMTNPLYASQFEWSLAPIRIKGLGLNCGLYFVGERSHPISDFPFYFDQNKNSKSNENFPVEKFITSDYPPASITTATDDFLKDDAQPLAEIIQSKGVLTEYHFYTDPSGQKLPHVFHLNLRSTIAQKCNLEQLNFFKKLM